MHRNSLYYHKLRVKLYSRLGGPKCALQGEPDIHGNYVTCHSELEVDHQDGREYEVRELGSAQRIRRYLKELDEGQRLRLLCKTHNGSDGYKKGKASNGKLRDRRTKKGS